MKKPRGQRSTEGRNGVFGNTGAESGAAGDRSAGQIFDPAQKELAIPLRDSFIFSNIGLAN